MNVGDKVSWTHVSNRGRTMSMSLREGIVESVKGDRAIVKKKRGRECILVSRLRVTGQKSQISEFVEAVIEATRDD